MTLKELNDRGYDIAEGDYHGTTDNRAGRWYLIKTSAPLRKWGAGFGSRSLLLAHCVIDTESDTISVAD